MESEKTELEQEFIPYHLAFRMKALGYDKPCFAFYNHKKELYDINPNSFTAKNSGVHYNVKFYNIFNKFIMVKLCTAPTWRAAFKWLRDKYNLWCFIQKYPTSENPNRCFYELKGNNINTDKDESPNSYMSLHWFNSYENAEIACLESLLYIAEKIEKENNQLLA